MSCLCQAKQFLEPMEQVVHVPLASWPTGLKLHIQVELASVPTFGLLKMKNVNMLTSWPDNGTVFLSVTKLTKMMMIAHVRLLQLK